VKTGIHPEYHQAAVRCACGEEFVVGSTRKEIRLEVCSKCHPFFTGKQKYVDTAGRVDKFFRRYGDGTPKKKKKKPVVEAVMEETTAEGMTSADEEAEAQTESVEDLEGDVDVESVEESKTESL